VLVFLVCWGEHPTSNENVILIISITFVTLASTMRRLPEDAADALKHVGVITIYKILLICICWSG